MLFSAEVAGSFTADIIEAEVEAVYADYKFPSTVLVITGDCGEANAFYDPSDQSIIMCEEFEDHLRDLYRMLEP